MTDSIKKYRATILTELQIPPQLPHNSKLFYLLRHAEALHNQLSKEIGTHIYFDKTYTDPPLTHLGRNQILKIKEKIQTTLFDIIVVSPLDRTLQTYNEIYGDKEKPWKTPVIALEYIREIHGRHYCDKRHPISHKKHLYPEIQFFVEHDEDIHWKEERETEDQARERAWKFIEEIFKRTEQKLLVISHAAFIRILVQMLSNVKVYLENCEFIVLHIEIEE